MSLKVAILSSAPGGGAGIAAARLYRALDAAGDCSVSLIDIESMGGPVPADAAPPRSLTNHRLTNTHYTIEYPGDVRGWFVEMLSTFDVVNVHWATYLISLGEIDALTGTGRPVVFTCHDYYYFTGGCHYPAGCRGFVSECLGCPQVDTSACEEGVVPLNLAIKRRILRRDNVHVVAPSRFLIDRLKEGSGISAERTHVIRNAYEVLPSRAGSEGVNPLPRIVLMADSLSERRKGMALALDALILAGRRRGFAVDLIGTANPALEGRLEGAGFEIRAHGRIGRHERIVKVLRGADLMLTGSFEDNWPNILVEAACYGCVPVVGPGHGCEEFAAAIDGEVATDYTAEAFAEATVQALSRISARRKREAAARAIEMHQPASIARRYLEVYSRAAA